MNIHLELQINAFAKMVTLRLMKNNVQNVQKNAKPAIWCLLTAQL